MCQDRCAKIYNQVWLKFHKRHHNTLLFKATEQKRKKKEKQPNTLTGQLLNTRDRMVVH